MFSAVITLSNLTLGISSLYLKEGYTAEKRVLPKLKLSLTAGCCVFDTSSKISIIEYV